jgi:hypothetical protein
MFELYFMAVMERGGPPMAQHFELVSHASDGCTQSRTDRHGGERRDHLAGVCRGRYAVADERWELRIRPAVSGISCCLDRMHATVQARMAPVPTTSSAFARSAS